MTQAAAVTRGGEQLISDLQQHKDALGSLLTWAQKYGLNTPIADPELAGVQAELASFAALQPAMHGFRGMNALDTFEKIIGAIQKDPDAAIASIRGIMKTAGALLPKPTPIAKPAQGETTKRPTFDEWKKAQAKP
jgi:hypothetical protein